MLNIAPIQLISFDCYGTLVDWETGLLNALRPVIARHEIMVSDDDLLALFATLEAAAERGPFRPYRTILHTVMHGFGEHLGFTPTPEELAVLADTLPDWPIFPDTIAALHQLKQRFQLAIISNVDDALFAGTAHHLSTDFDFVVTAEQVQAYKPSPHPFEAALKRFGIPKTAWLHVGQSLYHDMVPAQALGLQRVWVNRRQGKKGAGATSAVATEVHPTLEVPNLQTLTDLLMD